MNFNNTILIIFLIFFLTKSFGQSHKFGIKAGYAKSWTSVPDNQVNFNGNNVSISEGARAFKGLDNFQIGIYSFIDIGYDFLHLDLSPQYSRYGFQDNQNFNYDYVDIDIGFSNFNAEVPSNFVFGLGVTPSFILTSNDIEDINNFDLKVYLTFGYRFYKDFVFSTQFRYGVFEIIPESKITNLQLSFNIFIPILKIKK